MGPKRRRAARVLLLDPQDRILLLHGFDPRERGRQWWFTPGGGVEDGEELADAAYREIAEETGIRDARLGALLATRATEFEFDGRMYAQDEWYYLARTDTVETDASGQTELELRSTDELRWWTLDELNATRETIYPNALAKLLGQVLREGPPARPVRLSGPRLWSTMVGRTHS
ncbi:NUDIX hydrolase [Streptacidiphilus neutrinimicus]|uniref:NUDIX hydrolase n=1 Tax=Streptacidiphilus neutrinimicus TaxID=105420 RepID=UPI0005A8FD6A|nr:NUDIX domain-containing protein [Streptacidiphilus neutrinimicus]